MASISDRCFDTTPFRRDPTAGFARKEARDDPRTRGQALAGGYAEARQHEAIPGPAAGVAVQVAPREIGGGQPLPHPCAREVSSLGLSDRAFALAMAVVRRDRQCGAGGGLPTRDTATFVRDDHVGTGTSLHDSGFA